MLQLRLEADHVPQRAKRVVLAKLDDRVRPAAGPRIIEANGLHRTEAQRVAAAVRHHLDRQAAIEVGRRSLPLLEGCLVAGQQRVDERFVFGLRHWAIEIIRAGPSRSDFVVTRLKPGNRRVDAVAMHDRCDRIEEGEEVFPGQPRKRGAQCRRRQRARGDDGVLPVIGWQAVELAAFDGNERV